jgi:pilus assembly protein Flp/PilA
MLAHFVNDESGATTIEYAMIVAGISLGIIVSASGLGSKLTMAYELVKTELNNRAFVKDR